jgi:hypothetical protein
LVLVAVVASMVIVRDVQAQTASGGGSGLRWGPGLAFQRGVFGDDVPKVDSEVGLTIAAQWCNQAARGSAFVLDSLIWLNRLENPHFEERLRLVHLQGGSQWGERTYVRAVVGIAFHFWSGPAAERAADLSLSAGIAVGRNGRQARLA